MRLWLGTHKTVHLERTDVGLCVSRFALGVRKRLPVAAGPWILDSGGFTELERNHGWSIGADEYADEVERYAREIGNLEWAAPQDWMCEPKMLEKTGLDVATHQNLTLENFLRLRDRLGPLVVPVLQGWEPDDYRHHVDLYERAGVALTDERVVGVGSVCRRQRETQIADLFWLLASDGLRLHGFGVKKSAIAACWPALTSIDSTAWSYRARMHTRDTGEPSLATCTHPCCNNCLDWALSWRREILDDLVRIPIQPPLIGGTA